MGAVAVGEAAVDASAGPDLGAPEVAAVLEYVFRNHPHCARRAGLHEFDARLPHPAPRSVTELSTLRATALGRLAALPDSADPGLRADLHAAAKFAEIEQFEVEGLGWSVVGPPEHLAEVDVSMYLRGSYVPLPERIAALTAHLEQVPGFLREAGGRTAARMPAGARLRSLEQAFARAAELRELPGRLAAEQPGVELDRVRAAAEPAAAACEEYARGVGQSRPVAGVLGPDLLAGYLAALEGVVEPVLDLFHEAEAEVAAIAAEIDRLAARLGAADRPQAYGLLGERIDDRPLETVMRSVIDSAEEFWHRVDVVPVTVATPLEISVDRCGPTSAEVVFDVAGPLERGARAHVLRIPDPGDGADPAGLRRQYLNEPMLHVIALHETFAGHYVHTEASRGRLSVMRSCVRWSAGFPEGWSHYVEGLAVEQGYAEGRPLVELAQLRSALEAGTRLLVFLAVHLRRLSFAQAAERAAALCHWTPERALREVLLTTSHISSAMYALGRLRIRAWRRSLGIGAAREEHREELRTFHDRILRCGYAPLSTVWNHHRDLRAAASAAAHS